MRSDMSKLLCERPRIGGGSGKARSERRKYNDPSRDVPHKITGKRQQGYEHKELNEYLNPLIRFLRANVGRPWDKVYSEIRKEVRLDTAVQYHVVQHLRDFVETDVVMDGKTPYTPSGHKISGRWTFYVHPRTGLLCIPIAPKRAKVVGNPEGWHQIPIANLRYYFHLGNSVARWKASGAKYDWFVRTKSGATYCRYDGNWYEAKIENHMARYKGPEWDGQIYDLVLGEIVYSRSKKALSTYGAFGVTFGGHGRRLSAKEVTRLKLAETAGALS